MVCVFVSWWFNSSLGSTQKTPGSPLPKFPSIRRQTRSRAPSMCRTEHGCTSIEPGDLADRDCFLQKCIHELMVEQTLDNSRERCQSMCSLVAQAFLQRTLCDLFGRYRSHYIS